MSVAGSFGMCCCDACECERRVSAVKDWHGWLPFGSDPSAELLTTRYRTLTVEVEWTITGEFFQGQPDWAMIDSSVTSGDVVAFGLNWPCGSANIVNAYQAYAGTPINYAFWPGGTFRRTYVCTIKRKEQGTGLLGTGWVVPPRSTEAAARVPSGTMSDLSIVDEGFEAAVLVMNRPHPGAYFGSPIQPCCDVETESYTDPAWETTPLPAPAAPYDVVGCANLAKFMLDSFMDGGALGPGGTPTETVSGGGLVLTCDYSDSISYSPSTLTVSVRCELSDPYTLEEALADAEDLLAKIGLCNGESRFDCGPSELAVVCGGETGESNVAVTEDFVCDGGLILQSFRVGAEEDVFAPGLDTDLLAQRLWYDDGHGAYVVVTKTRHNCGAGTTVRTTLYTHPNNVTNTPGTPTDSDPDPTGWQTFKMGSGEWGTKRVA